MVEGHRPPELVQQWMASWHPRAGLEARVLACFCLSPWISTFFFFFLQQWALATWIIVVRISGVTRLGKASGVLAGDGLWVPHPEDDRQAGPERCQGRSSGQQSWGSAGSSSFQFSQMLGSQD